MSLLEDVSAAIADAMRAQDQASLAPLRMLKTALTNRRIDKGRELDEGEARQAVATLVKQRRESIEQFTKGNRLDLATKEAAEIQVLERYLPPAADPTEVEGIIDRTIAECGASSPKDLGRVMKAVMAALPGRSVDGKAVNELVRRKLEG